MDSLGGDPLDRVNVLDVTFDNVTKEQAVTSVIELVESGRTAYVVTPNSEIAYECIKDGAFREIINSADLIVPDGAGVVLASKILRRPLKQKVAGVELAAALLRELAKRQKKLFTWCCRSCGDGGGGDEAIAPARTCDFDGY